MPLVMDETDEHATVVADVHDVLLHAADAPSDAVALGSIESKFKPEIVTKSPPVCGTLYGLMPVMTGAARKRMAVWVRQARPAKRITYVPSKLNTSPIALVPTIALTVRTVRRVPPLPYCTG